MSYNIKLENVTKKYDDLTAINNINFTLEAGKVYGLIGRNGAGKTTFLKLLSNKIFPTSGTIRYNPEHITNDHDICFMRDQNHHFTNYQIKNIFYLASKIYPNWDEKLKNKLVDHFEIKVKKVYSKCSKGIQTLTAIIIALSSNAKVLLLDEPYSGLDPVNRESFYQILRELCFNGERTVILSSHLINEIEGYFEKAVLIEEGKILIDEEVETIYEKSFAIHCDEQLADKLRKTKNVLKEETVFGEKILYIYDDFTEQEKNQMIIAGAEIKGMDLQKLLVAHCNRMEVKEWI